MFKSCLGCVEFESHIHLLTQRELVSECICPAIDNPLYIYSKYCLKMVVLVHVCLDMYSMPW